MTNDNPLQTNFSTHLFWDVDRKGFVIEENAHFIIKRVLEYGFMSDWNFLLKTFGIVEIVKHAKELRELDKRSLSFISTLSKTPKEEFRCFTTKLLTGIHWDF